VNLDFFFLVLCACVPLYPRGWRNTFAHPQEGNVLYGWGLAVLIFLGLLICAKRRVVLKLGAHLNQSSPDLH